MVVQDCSLSQLYFKVSEINNIKTHFKLVFTYNDNYIISLLL